MADGPSLNPELIKDFITNLDKVYRSLLDIEKKLNTLGEVQVNVRLSDETIKSADSINKLSSSLRRLNAITLRDSQDAATSLVRFADLIEEANIKFENTDVNALVKTTRSLENAVQTLTSTAVTLADLGKVEAQDAFKFIDEVLFKFYQRVESLVSTAAQVKPSSLKRLTEIVTSFTLVTKDFANLVEVIKTTPNAQAAVRVLNNAFSPLFKSLESLIVTAKLITPTRLQALSQTVDSLGDILPKMASSLSSVAELDNARKAATALEKSVIPFFKGFSDLVKSSQSITPDRLRGLGESVSSLGDILEQISKAVDSVASIDKAEVAVKIVSNAVVPFLESLASLVKASQGATPERLNALALLIPPAKTLIFEFTALTNLLADSKVSDKSLKDFQDAIVSFLSALATLVTASGDTTPAKLEQLSLVIATAKRLFTELVKSFNDLKGFRLPRFFTADSFSKIVGFFDSLQSLVKATEKTTPDRLANLNPVIKTAGEVLTSIVDLLKLVSGIGLFKRVLVIEPLLKGAILPLFQQMPRLILAAEGVKPTALQSLSVIVRGFADFFLTVLDLLEFLSSRFGSIFSFDFVVLIRRFNEIITTIVRFIREIARVVDSAKGESLLGAGALLEGLAQFIGVILPLFDRVQSAFTVIDSLVTFLADLIKLNLIFNALATFIRNVSKAVEGVNAKALEGASVILLALPDVLDSLEPSLSSLSGATRFIDIKFIRNLGRLRSFFLTLGTLIGAIAGSVKGANPESLKGAALILDSFRLIFPELQRLFKYLQQEPGIFNLQVIKSFSRLRTFFSAVGELIKPLKNLKDAKNVDFTGVAQLVGEMPRLVRILRDLQTDDLPKKESVRNLREILSVIADLTNISFKKADKIDFSFLSDLGRLNDLPNLDVRAAKRVKDFINELAKANFDKLASNSFDARPIKEFGAALRDLDKSSSANVSNNFQQINDSVDDSRVSFNQASLSADSLAEAVDDGFANALVRVELLQAAANFLQETFRRFRELSIQTSAIGITRTAVDTLREAGEAAKELGENLRDAGETARDAGQSIIENMGVGKIFGSSAFSAATEFDALGTNLQVFGGLSDEARKQAEAFANELGAKYPLSANEALAATLDLIKAGEDLSSVEFILPSAADLAALSDSGSIEQATTALIAAQAGFSEFAEGIAGDFENINVAADILAAGADVSTASVESLSEGLANVGPAANAFGLSLEETTAVLAIFDQNAIKGAEGGTALRSTLDSLNRPQTINALKEIGVSLFDDGGDRRPLNDIINDIGASLEGLPDSQRAAILQTLADTFGRQGLEILLNQGADAIDNMVDSMQGVAPASERAKASLDNLRGDMQQLQGSVETLLVRALLPLIDRFARPFAQFALNVVNGLLNLNDATLSFISTSVVLASVVATAFGAFLIFSGVLLQVGGAILILVGSLLNIVGIIVAVVGGAAAMAAGFVTITVALAGIIAVAGTAAAIFQTLFEVFRNDLGGARTAAVDFFTEVREVLTEVGLLAQQVLTLFSRIFGSSGATAILEAAGNSIAGFFSNLQSALNSGRIAQIREGVEAVSSAFQAFNFAFAFGERVEILAEAAREQINLYDDIVDKESAFAEAYEQIQRQQRAAASEAILDIVRTNGILSKLFSGQTDQQIVDSFFNILTAAENFQEAFREGVIKPIAAFPSALQNIGLSGALDQLTSDLDDGLGEASAVLLNFFGDFFNADSLKDLAKTASTDGFGSFVAELLSGFRETLLAGIVDNRDFLKEAFVSLITFFFSPLNAAAFFANLFGLESLSNLIGEFQKIIETILGGVFDTVVNLIEGQSLDEALRNAFGDGIDEFIDLASEIGRTVQNVFEIISGVFERFFSGFVQEGESFSLINVLRGFADALSNVLGVINDILLDPLSEGDVLGALENLGGFVADILSGIVESVVGAPLDKLGEQAVGLGTFVVNTLLKGIQQGLNLLQAFTGLDLSSAIGAIEETLSANLNAQNEPFAVVSNTISGLIASALNVALTGVDKLLDIDTSAIRDKINDNLKTTFEANATTDSPIAVAANNFAAAQANVISAAVGTIGELLNIDTSGILDTISTNLKTTLDANQSAGPIQALGNTFASAVATALSAGLGVIGELLDIDTSGILDTISTNLKTTLDANQSAGPIQVLGNTFASTVATALSAGLATIGALLNIDTTPIQNAISEQLKTLLTYSQDAGPVGAIGNALAASIAAVLTSAVGTIGGLLNIDTQPVLDAITTSLKQTVLANDGASTFQVIANSIIGALGTALVAAFGAFASLAGLDAGAITGGINDTIVTAFASIGAGDNPFQVVGTTVVGALGAAISAAFLTIGDALGLDTAAISAAIQDNLQPVLDSINNIFDAESGVFANVRVVADNLIDGFVRIKDAVVDFFDSVTGSAGDGESLTKISTFFGELAALPIAAIGLVADTITEVTTALTLIDPVALAGAAVSIGVVVVALNGAAIAGAALAAVNFLAPVAGLLAVIIIVKNLAANLGDALTVFEDFVSGLSDAFTALGEGDIAGAISGFGITLFNLLQEAFNVGLSVLAGIGLDILELLGLDTLLGISREQIELTLRQVQFFISNLGLFVGQAFDDIALGIERVAQDARATLVGLGNEQLFVNLENIQKSFTDLFNNGLNVEVDGKNPFAEILRSYAELGDTERAEIELLIQENIRNYVDTFQDALADGTLDEGQFTAFAESLVNAGEVNKALAIALSEGDIDFANALIQEVGDSLASADPGAIDDIVKEIENLFFQSGDLEGALSGLFTLRAELDSQGLDTASVDRAIRELEEERDRLQGEIAEVTGETVEGELAVTIDSSVEYPEFTPEEAQSVVSDFETSVTELIAQAYGLDPATVEPYQLDIPLEGEVIDGGTLKQDLLNQAITLMSSAGLEVTDAVVQDLKVAIGIDPLVSVEPETFTAAIQTATDAASAGADATTQVQGNIDVNPNPQIDPVASQTALTTSFQTALSTTEATASVEGDITVVPIANLDEVAASATIDSLIDTTQSLIDSTSVDVSLDLADITMPENLGQAAADLDAVTSSANDLVTSATNLTAPLDGVAQSSSAAGLALTTTDAIALTTDGTLTLVTTTVTALGTALTTTGTQGTSAFNSLSAAAANFGSTTAASVGGAGVRALQSFVQAANIIRAQVPAAFAQALQSANQFGSGASGAMSSVQSSVNSTISSVNRLTNAFKDAAAAAEKAASASKAANEAAAAGGGATTGGGTVPGAALGADVAPNSIVEITEGGSEVFTENGKTYLLTGRRPGMSRIDPLNQFLPELDTDRFGGGGETSSVINNVTNNYNTSNQGGPVTIIIQGDGLNPQQVAQAIRSEIQNTQFRTDPAPASVRRNLRRANT